MKFQVAIFFLAISQVLAQYAADINRNGLISDIPGYAISYYSSRWEPLCGTVTSVPSMVGYVRDLGTDCLSAIDRFTNDTRSTLSFYDSAGVKLVGAGVGLGRKLCMCFSMSTNTGTSHDICWSFNGLGQYNHQGRGIPDGSTRPGSAKALPACGDVDVNALQAAWTRTAVMPQETGPVMTINTGPTTVLQTVTEVLTSTLTPTLVNLTITSSAVVTGTNGQPSTQDRTYTTTAAVINFQPAAEEGLSTGNRIALGVGLGLGSPSLFVAIGAWCYSGNRQRAHAAGNPPRY